MAPEDTTISKVESLATPKPHCRIDGYVTTRNPGPNQGHFRLQLPDTDWNGRYFFIGLGGAAGYVPTEAQLPHGNPITAGWAVAGTDTGHQGNVLDWSFLRDHPDQRLDYHSRGTHVTARATQQITRQYYQTDKLYRYISGCSGGGRMGVMAAENHPEDFDGYLIGAPGRSAETFLMFMWTSQVNLREPDAWVPPSKLAFVEKNVKAACDATDGVEDQMVWDPAKCDFDIASLQCSEGQEEDCLSATHVETIRQVLRGPHGPDGKRITYGMPITNMGSGWPSFYGAVPPPWPEDTSIESLRKSSSGYVMGHVMTRVYFGPDYDFVEDFDFNDRDDLDAFWQGTEKYLFGQPHKSDLTGVEKAGGKVIWWHGVSDAGPTAPTSLDYFRLAKEKMGGNPERLADTARLYLIPGMLHCSGGTGPHDAPDRLLETLVDWVENGKEPGSVVTHRGPGNFDPVFKPVGGENVAGVRLPNATGNPRDFRLCPYPQISTFQGGNAGVGDAKNWHCRQPNP